MQRRMRWRTPSNAQVIQGALSYLTSTGVTVGIYSTATQWRTIAGTYSPGLPNWVAGAPDLGSAPTFCDASHAFGGGPVWLVQYPAGSYDGIYGC
jgi:hypothetical protein